MSSNSSNYSVKEIIVIIILAVGAGYVCAGFFYPDKFFLRRASKFYTYISWGVRLLLPVLFVLALFIYHRVKMGRIAASNIALLIGSLVVVALLLYPFANYFYNRANSFENNIGLYHPYLQLSPKDFKAKDSSIEDPVRIFCLGGSTTEWRDKDKRDWPSRVQEHVRSSGQGQSVEVYNMGRQWYSSLHSLINYQVNLREHSPDVLIVMHVINDLLHNADFSYFSHEPFRSDYRHFYGPVNDMVTREGFESYLYGKFKRFWFNKDREYFDPPDFPGLASFRRNLNTIIDLASLDGTHVVLMTQPSLFKESMTEAEIDALYMVNNEAIGPTMRWHYTTARRAFEAYNNAIRDVAATRGAYLIDLADQVPKSLEYFTDDVHYKKPAYDIIGEFVSKELISQGIVTMAADRN